MEAKDTMANPLLYPYEFKVLVSAQWALRGQLCVIFNHLDPWDWFGVDFE